MNGVSRLVLMLGLATGALQPVVALELFGVNLESTSRDELSGAVIAAGVKLIRASGEAEGFDAYDSSAVLAGSNRFYLGFVGEDQRFAFAEYEFHGLNRGSMLRRLTARYGAAEIRAGRFVSDRAFRWQQDGIDITLTGDWQNSKTRLSYVHPGNLAALQAEQSTDTDPEEATTKVTSFY
jgi:hypothetical protein